MARVVVIGPNLSGAQSRKDYSTFHVHAEGCADITRSPLYRSREYDYDKKNVVDYANVIEIAADVYSDHIDEEQTAESLVNEFRVFPCVQFDEDRTTKHASVSAIEAALNYTPGPGSIAGRVTGTTAWTPESGWTDSTKKEVSTMVTVTFELFTDGIFFNMSVETTKDNLSDVLADIFAMKNTRAIQY